MSDTSPPPLRTNQAWIAAVVATLVMSVSYIDRQTLSVLAPTVREALAISREQYGELLSAFSLSYLVGAPFAGAMLDRIGPRRGLLVAVLVWSAVAAAHALVPWVAATGVMSGFAALFIMRVALGLAEAPSFPGAALTIRRVLPRDKRSAAFGMLFTGSSIGATIAPPLAIGILAWTKHWPFAFIGTALVGLAWIPAWVFITSRRGVREALARPDIVAPSVNAAPLGSRYALLREPAVIRAIVMVVASAPSVMFGLLWLSQYFVDTFALKQTEIGGYLIVPQIFFDLGAVTFGVLASRIDQRARGEKRTHATLMIAAAALSSTLAFVPLLHGVWSATALISVCLAGGGGIYALVTADVLARVDPRHASTTSGLCAAAQSLAYIVANPAVGKAVDVTKSYETVLLVIGGIVLPVAVAWSLWPIAPVAQAARPE